MLEFGTVSSRLTLWQYQPKYVDSEHDPKSDHSSVLVVFQNGSTR